LIFALKMLEDRIVARPQMRGSWAGAMGLTQFMPSEFYDTAQALSPGRKPDLFGSVDDALASAANQLKVKGWKPGMPWGLEVKLPPSVSCAQEGVPGQKPLRDWLKTGIAPIGNRPVPEAWLDQPVFLLAPAGTNGPVFLAFENFLVLKAYNFADLYALFVGNLADRIAGRPDFATPWADLKMLSTAELETVQTGLKAAGEPIEKIDGKAGMNTRSSIGRFQARSGLRVDCWPTRDLLERLKAKR
jgi:membrane-bound lytic murein transglycosylase B